MGRHVKKISSLINLGFLIVLIIILGLVFKLSVAETWSGTIFNSEDGPFISFKAASPEGVVSFCSMQHSAEAYYLVGNES